MIAPDRVFLSNIIRLCEARKNVGLDLTLTPGERNKLIDVLTRILIEDGKPIAISPKDYSSDPYIGTIERLEPNIAMIDPGAFFASAAISLKRIADAVTEPPAELFGYAWFGIGGVIIGYLRVADGPPKPSDHVEGAQGPFAVYRTLL